MEKRLGITIFKKRCSCGHLGLPISHSLPKQLVPRIVIVPPFHAPFQDFRFETRRNLDFGMGHPLAFCHNLEHFELVWPQAHEKEKLFFSRLFGHLCSSLAEWPLPRKRNKYSLQKTLGNRLFSLIGLKQIFNLV